ncbi:hypothetical protein [Methyloceanibacter sp. wino2]|uniref:hypothetical protein n=1 Tax=Methyloceanibacter sp. wino2 TaxID=2170729 RepID=UPI00131F1B41|nr:hypothetical protein [Methyloceanibacter sp. wino2]
MGPTKELILHIGRSKTGTSSLQHYLSNNRAALVARGICYPKTGCGNGVAHHEIARACCNLGLFGPKLRALRAAFEEEVAPFDRLILSSENFQQVLLAHRLLYFFGDSGAWPNEVLKHYVFPSKRIRPYRITSICYLREYLEYASSSYAQNVQNSNQTRNLTQYCKKHFRRPLSKFVDLWKRFSDDAIFVGYDRRKLFQQDVVADFFNRIDVPPMAPVTETDANPSISGNLLAFKLLVNRNVPHTRDLYRAFRDLALLDARYRGRMFVSDALSAALRKRGRNYNARLEQLVGQVEERSFENGNRFDASQWKHDMECFLDHPNLSKLKDRPEIFRTLANDAAKLVPQ